jgi:hypothetical protein
MLPQDLVVKYWLDVRELLQKECGLSGPQADRGIREYVALAEKHGFTGAIYHRKQEETAEIIRYGVQHEQFPEPAAV